MTEKFRSAAHWSCNINLQLTKKVPVISQFKRLCQSFILYELRKFDAETGVIPNRLEKYMAFILRVCNL